VLGSGQFGFRRGKGTRDAIGMLRIISERILDLDEGSSIIFDGTKEFRKRAAADI
jgi:hypothetical protein